VNPALAEWTRASAPENKVTSIQVDPALLRNSKRLILSDLFEKAATQQPPADPTASLQPEDQPVFQRLQTLVQKGQQPGQKADAVRQILALAETFPNSSLTPEILFQAALLEEEKSEQRVQSLYRVIQRDPQTLAARKSALALGETFFQMQDFPYALDAFKAYALAQGPGAAEPVFRFRVVNSLMRLRNYQGALDQLNGMEWSNASSRTVQKALDLKGECLAVLGRANDAVPLLRAFLLVYPDYELAAKVELTLGFCYEELRQINEAKTVYARIAQVYAADTFEAQIAQTRLASLGASLFGPEPAAPNSGNANKTSNANPGNVKHAAPRRVQEEIIQAQNALEGPGISGRPPVSTPEMLYAPPVLNAPETPNGPQGENLLDK
jgi:tetratricopeptide (TPR) repeat protein